MEPRNLHRQQKQVVEPPQLPQQRTVYFIFSVLSALVFFYIWLSVPPANIQNAGIHNSYLPLLLAVFGCCASAIAFCTNARRGVVYGFVFTLFVFLRLQQIHGMFLLPALLFPVMISDFTLTYRKQA